MRIQRIASLWVHASIIGALSNVENALPRPCSHNIPNSPAHAQINQVGRQLTAPQNRTVRYKKVDICETTEGVSSYSGYIDVDEQSHLFFWFFEARRSPESAPITLWLNGGPGTDSLLGLFTGNVCGKFELCYTWA